MEKATYALKYINKASTSKQTRALRRPTKPIKAMVDAAIRNQVTSPRKGVSLQAIKNYIALKYDTDVKKINTRIQRYIQSSVNDGKYVQTRGKGAVGSFRFSAAKKSRAAKNKRSKKRKQLKRLKK